MKTLEYYIEDTLNQLLDEAIEAKKSNQTELDRGILIGYYRSLLRMLNQAKAFDIEDKLPERIRKFNLESLLDEFATYK